MAATTFGSYAMGLLRDRIFAQTFGLSSELDAYNAAFLLPDFLFNLLVASGISAAVVPLFASLHKKGKKDAYEYINSVISAALGAMIVVAILLIFFAEPAVHLVAPGLDSGNQEIAAKLIRILAFSPLLFALSNTLGAMLIGERRFLFYGISPIVYNLGIITGTLVLAPTMGVTGVALGTIGGGILHAGVRMFDAYRSGWRPEFKAAWRTKEFRGTVKLMLPKMVGHPVELVTFWIFTAFASTLAAGSISALNFARNFQSVPVSLIGITVSTAAFPILAEAIAAKKTKEFTQTLWRIISSIFFLSSLAALALFFIREPLIQILLGGGSFDTQATARTAAVLGVFCLAIPTESVNHLLARSFYARKNTVIPVLFSVIALLVAVGGAWIFMPQLGLRALPLGFFIGSLTKSVGLIILSQRAVAANRL